MEVCGGQTHSIVRYGIDRLLPPDDRARARPGLPGVRDLARDDRSRARDRRAARRHLHVVRRHAARARLARRSARGCAARGADVRVVYSPLDARRARARQPATSRVVFFAHRLRDHRAGERDGASAGAKRERLDNFSMLVSHVLVPPAIATILQAPDNRVQGFLGPGHVCAVMGCARIRGARRALPRADRRSPASSRSTCCEGVLMAVQQLEAGRAEVENQYARTVAPRRQPRGARR